MCSKTLSLLTLACVFHKLAAFQLKGKYNVVPGVVLERIAPPIFYDSFIPVVLEFKRPILNSSVISTEQFLLRSCNSSAYAPNTPCPTSFYIKEEIDSFLNFFNHTEPNSNLYSRTYGHFSSWTSIEDDLRSYTTHYSTNEAVNSLIDRITSESPVSFIYIERNITSHQYINSSYLQKMMTGFEKEFWEDINADRIDDALFANAISIYQTKIFQQYILEMMRWSQAVSDCKNNKVPTNLVPYEKLNAILNHLRPLLNEDGYNLSLGVDASVYYQTQLTTCVATETSLFVTTRLPLRSIESNAETEYLQVHTIPFYLPARYSTSSDYGICFIHFGDMKYLHDFRTGRVTTVMCDPHQLCERNKRLSGFGEECIKAVLNEDGPNIHERCFIICEQGDEYPYIVPLGNGTVAVAGRQGGVLIKCPNKPDELFMLTTVGTILLTLPSKQCRVVPADEIVTGSNSRSNVVPSLPVHWNRDKKIGTFDNVRFQDMVGDFHEIMFESSGHDNTVIVAVLSIIVFIMLCCMLFLFVSMRKLRREAFTGHAAGMYYVNGMNISDEEPARLLEYN